MYIGSIVCRSTKQLKIKTGKSKKYTKQENVKSVKEVKDELPLKMCMG